MVYACAVLSAGAFFLFLPGVVCGAPLLSEEERIARAKALLEASDFYGAETELEAIAIDKLTDVATKQLLLDAYIRHYNYLKDRKLFKQCIPVVIKILALKPREVIWHTRLHNLYWKAEYYKDAITYGKWLLEKKAELGLDGPNIARIYSRMAYIYHKLDELARMYEALSLAVDYDRSLASIRAFVDMLNKDKNGPVFLKEGAESFEREGKIVDAYNLYLLYRAYAITDRAGEEKLASLGAILKEKPELMKDRGIVPPPVIGARLPSGGDMDEMETVSRNTDVPSPKDSAEKQVAGGISAKSQPGIPTGQSSASRAVTSSEGSSSVSEAVPPTGKTVSAESGKDRLGHYYLGLKYFREQEYERAYEEFTKAQEEVPDELKNEVRWHRFKAYFWSRQLYLRQFVIPTIVILAIIFILYVSPLGRRSDQYGLINVGKTLKKAENYMERGNFLRAVEEYEKLVELNLKPEQELKVNLDLARAYFELKRFSNAIAFARKALSIDGENIEAFRILGAIYLKMKDRTSRALEVYRYLIAKGHGNAQMLEIVANENARSGVVDEATYDIYRKLLEQDPDHELANRMVARWYNQIGRTDEEALRFFKNVVERFPRDTSLRLILIETYFKRKEYDRVVSECIYLFSLDPDNLKAHAFFIDAIVQLKKTKLLLSEYDRLKSENPGDPVIEYLRSALHSILVERKKPGYELFSSGSRLNFVLCARCLNINLREYTSCQRCGAELYG